MMMKAETLLDRVRVELGDEVEPYFWKEPELLGYLDEGQREFCREVPIRDSRTEEVCKITFSAGTSEVPIHKSIKKVLSILREDSNGDYTLVPMATEENEFHQFSGGLGNDYGLSVPSTRRLTTASDYFKVYVEYDEGFMRFSSPALTAGTLRLQVDRLPLKVLENCSQNLEIRDEYGPALIAWTCYRAWAKQDSEVFDPQASSKQLSLFVDHTTRARIEKKRQQSQPGVVRCAWI
jgi:hypothetical protein